MNVYLLLGTQLSQALEVLQAARSRLDWEGVPALIVKQPPVPQLDGWQLYPEPAESDSWPEAANVVWLLDPREALPEEIRRVAACMAEAALVPAKVITLVDCGKAAQIPELQRYYEACIHFSDAVLLGNRSDSEQKWLRAWQQSFRRNCYPCLFYFVKSQGRAEPVREIWHPENRRLSHIFDRQEMDEEAPGPIPDWEASFDLDGVEDFDSPEDDPILSGQVPVPQVSAHCEWE